MLQNLANKPSYAKEAYMQSLHPFVENNKARINQFLNALCEVGDFYETLEMDQYMALSKKDLMINITMNELYNTHSLILQHVDVLVSNGHLLGGKCTLMAPTLSLLMTSNTCAF
jgi:Ras GTPase-activating-like protein IQGAP2/3